MARKECESRASSQRQAGWLVHEFAPLVHRSVSAIYADWRGRRARAPRYVRFGTRRVIVEAPEEYLLRIEELQRGDGAKEAA